MKKSSVYFLGGSIIILVLPILLTQTGIILVDFTNTGEIGDTIGGITAPFVGLFGAYLVYNAFVAQIEANKIQSKSIELQSRDREFSIALKLLDDIEKSLVVRDKVYELSFGAMHGFPGSNIECTNRNYFDFLEDWKDIAFIDRNKFSSQLTIIFNLIDYFKNFVFQSPSLSNRDKILIFEKSSLMILYPIMGHVSSIGKDRQIDSEELKIAKNWINILNPIFEEVSSFLEDKENNLDNL